MNIKLYDEFNEELITRWSLFQKNSSFTVFQTVEWLQVWWKTFKGTNIKLQIVIIENDSKTIIILPLMISDTSLGLKKLSFLGQSHNDYNASLIIK
jgi:CelD/BcsL family acetyltransferase involved in cellulose biosynthesis